MFLRVTLMTCVGQALKSRKLTQCFIAPYQILKRVGKVIERVGLPSYLSNIHSVFKISQMRKYIPDLTHVIQLEDVQVR